MHGVKSQVRVRVQNPSARDVHVHQSEEPRPGQPPPLAPTPKRAVPAPEYLGPKAVQTIHVARDRVVVEVATNDGLQPLPRDRHWFVPAAAQRLLNFPQFRGEPRTDGLALDDEAAGLPGR